jgi:hypothetical protein
VTAAINFRGLYHKNTSDLTTQFLNSKDKVEGKDIGAACAACNIPHTHIEQIMMYADMLLPSA